MAELVQGQASVAQPGTKDDFADTIRRVRQVTPTLFSDHSGFKAGEDSGSGAGATPGTPPSPKLQTLLMHPAS